MTPRTGKTEGRECPGGVSLRSGWVGKDVGRGEGRAEQERAGRNTIEMVLRGRVGGAVERSEQGGKSAPWETPEGYFRPDLLLDIAKSAPYIDNYSF